MRAEILIKMNVIYSLTGQQGPEEQGQKTEYLRPGLKVTAPVSSLSTLTTGKKSPSSEQPE